jgi:hypothetical protein
MNVTLGHLYKYENRTVAVHAVTGGKPLCGSVVDLNAFEVYEGFTDEVTCQRCKARLALSKETC